MKHGSGNIDPMKKKLEQSSEQLEYLRAAGKGEKVRKELISFYTRHPYGEKMLWYDLAVFREAGPIGIINGVLPYTLFDLKGESLKKRIFSLIRKLPDAVLADFRELVVMTARVIERMDHICTMTILQFLEREKGEIRESCDTRVYTEYLTNKLFWEVEILYEHRDTSHMKDFCSEYERWLSDKVLTEEVIG